MYKTFEPGIGAVWDSITTPAAIHAFWLTVTVTAIAVPLNAAFGVLAALVLVRGKIRGRRVLEAFIDLPFAVSPVVVGLALVLLYGRTGWLGDELAVGRHQDHLLDAGHRARDDLRHPAVRRQGGRAGPARGRERPGAGGVDARRVRLADVLARHAPVDPLGPGVRSGPVHRPGDRRVRGGQRRLGQDLG